MMIHSSSQIKLIFGSLLAFLSQNIIQLVLLLSYDLPKDVFIILSIIPLLFFLVFMIIAFTVTSEKEIKNSDSGGDSSDNNNSSKSTNSSIQIIPLNNSNLSNRIINDKKLSTSKEAELVSLIVTNKHEKSKQHVINKIKNRSLSARIKLKARVAARKAKISIAKKNLEILTYNTVQKSAEDLISIKENLLKDFKRRDVDNDGSIDQTELLHWMQALLPQMNIKKEAAESIIASHDENMDGLLQYYELESWVEKLYSMTIKKRRKIKMNGQRFGLSNSIMDQIISFGEELLKV